MFHPDNAAAYASKGQMPVPRKITKGVKCHLDSAPAHTSKYQISTARKTNKGVKRHPDNVNAHTSKGKLRAPRNSQKTWGAKDLPNADTLKGKVQAPRNFNYDLICYPDRGPDCTFKRSNADAEETYYRQEVSSWRCYCLHIKTFDACTNKTYQRRDLLSSLKDQVPALRKFNKRVICHLTVYLLTRQKVKRRRQTTLPIAWSSVMTVYQLVH